MVIVETYSGTLTYPDATGFKVVGGSDMGRMLSITGKGGAQVALLRDWKAVHKGDKPMIRTPDRVDARDAYVDALADRALLEDDGGGS